MKKNINFLIFTLLFFNSLFSEFYTIDLNSDFPIPFFRNKENIIFVRLKITNSINDELQYLEFPVNDLLVSEKTLKSDPFRMRDGKIMRFSQNIKDNFFNIFADFKKGKSVINTPPLPK